MFNTIAFDFIFIIIKMENTNQLKLEFWAGNPSVELINGELTIEPFSDFQKNYNAFEWELQSFRQQGGRYLCCYNVPVHVSAIEFGEFISPKKSEFTREILHLRVLKGTGKETYIMLIKMTSNESAMAFINRYHCKPFSDIDPEKCHLSVLTNASIKSSGKKTS